MMVGGDAITVDALMAFTAPSQNVAEQQCDPARGEHAKADVRQTTAAAAARPAAAGRESQKPEATEAKPEIKSAYAQFCDMLRHPSAQPVVAKTREFVLRFPDGLPRAQAADKVHQFLSVTEQWMMSEIVVFAAEADEEGRTKANEGMEKFLLSRLHPKVFAADREDVAEDQKLHKCMSGLTWVTLKHLGVPPADDSLLPRAIEELKSIDQYKAPRDKMVCVMNACKVIQDMLKRTWAGQKGKPGVRALSADDFLPLLIYIVIQANPPRFHSNVEYVAAFRHPDRLGGEDAYFLTTLMSAKEFVKEAGPQSFDVAPDEYKQLYASSLAAAGLGPPPEISRRTSTEPIGGASSATPKKAHSQPPQDLLDAIPDVSATVEAAEPQSTSTVHEEDMGDDFERTLFNKRDVMVFQIPPASSSAGHKADDWKKCIWKGCCRVVGQGKELSIRLIDASSGQLFAQCVAPGGQYDKFVEPVTDSSRYFVLKVSHGQKHAFIGMGFEDRNDAFDFKCTLSDFKEQSARERDVSTPAESRPTPSKDLSLKDGQKITMKLKGVPTSKRDEKPAATASSTGILAPPPPPLGKPPVHKHADVAPVVPAGTCAEDFDAFGAFQCSETLNAQGQQPPAVTSLLEFDNAGLNEHQQQQQQVTSLCDDFASIDFQSASPLHPAASSIQESCLQQSAPQRTGLQQQVDPFDFAGIGGTAASSSPLTSATQSVAGAPQADAQSQWSGGYQQAAPWQPAMTGPPSAPAKSAAIAGDPFAQLSVSAKSEPFGEFDLRGLAAMQVTVS